MNEILLSTKAIAQVQRVTLRHPTDKIKKLHIQHYQAT